MSDVCLSMIQRCEDEMMLVQLGLLRVASFRFLSTLLCSSVYTDILVSPKGQCSSKTPSDDVAEVLKSAMKLMTQRAVLSKPISECIHSISGALPAVIPPSTCDDLLYISGSDRKSTRLNSSHVRTSRMPSSA